MRGEIAPFDWSLQGDLILALQRARSRFAVAVAADTKVTPLRRRAEYQAADERLRLYLRQLRLGREIRDRNPSGNANEALGCLRELLRCRPEPLATPELCRQLLEVIGRLEAPDGRSLPDR